MNTLPFNEVSSLLTAVSEHGKQHLAEVEADLQQTNYLLSKAIEKLSASFMAVHSAINNQRKVLDALMQQHHFAPDEASQLGMFNQIIDEEIDVAITGLQFQDITSQLLIRAIKRVNGLESLLQEITIHSHVLGTAPEQKEIANLMERLSQTLHTGSHALSGGLRRSVDQQNMASGDIELFWLKLEINTLLTVNNTKQLKKWVNEMAKTILAVDDSGSLRQMVTFSLKSAGYDVIQAVDGQDGLNKA